MSFFRIYSEFFNLNLFQIFQKLFPAIRSISTRILAAIGARASQYI